MTSLLKWQTLLFIYSPFFRCVCVSISSLTKWWYGLHMLCLLFPLPKDALIPSASISRREKNCPSTPAASQNSFSVVSSLGDNSVSSVCIAELRTMEKHEQKKGKRCHRQLKASHSSVIIGKSGRGEGMFVGLNNPPFGCPLCPPIHIKCVCAVRISCLPFVC